MEFRELGVITRFDNSTPQQLDSIAAMTLLIFVILVMCMFGLVMTSNISDIALRPLERMLSVVREHCKQIFKYTDELQEDEQSEQSGTDVSEYADLDQSSEFVILERVVKKLATMTEIITSKNEPVFKEGMKDDEVMVMNWMQGQQFKGPTGRSTQVRPNTSESEVQALAATNADEASDGISGFNITQFGLNQDIVDTLDGSYFHALDLGKEQRIGISIVVVLRHQGSANWVRTNVQEAQLHKFMTMIESKYVAENPFHHFGHGIDVEYAVSRDMKLINASSFMSEVVQFILMIAAVAHDVGHRGVNNQWLVETSDELALRYNDRSPLENMHCAKLFQVVSDPTANIFTLLEKDLFKEMRKQIIEAILHTDMMKHFDMVKELKLFYQMNSEMFDNWHDSGTVSAIVQEEMEKNQQLVINAMLHMSDVGNPAKPWELCKQWAVLCLEEFFAQGDLEKRHGIPVQVLNDRDKVNKPNSQIGFMEFVIAPIVEAVVIIFPKLDPLAEHLGNNIAMWASIWADEENPPEENLAKLTTRVQKVADNMQKLMKFRN